MISKIIAILITQIFYHAFLIFKHLLVQFRHLLIFRFNIGNAVKNIRIYRQNDAGDRCTREQAERTAHQIVSVGNRLITHIFPMLLRGQVVHPLGGRRFHCNVFHRIQGFCRKERITDKERIGNEICTCFQFSACRKILAHTDRFRACMDQRFACRGKSRACARCQRLRETDNTRNACAFDRFHTEIGHNERKIV